MRLFLNKIHSSWLLALAAGGFVCGVSMAPIVWVPFGWVVLCFVVLSAAFVFSRVWTIPVIAAASILVGVGFGSAHFGQRGLYTQWVGQVVALNGKVKEDPSKSSSGGVSLQLDTVIIEKRVYSGVIFASARGIPDVKRGDIVTGQVTVKEGFGSFPVSVTFVGSVSVTRPEFGDVGRVVRDWFADKVRTLLPEPQSSLGIGFLTGQKSALPEDFADALKIAGLTHIVVASGYNLTILVRMARKLFLRVSKYLSALSAAVMILAFMAITGLSPSMTRAGLVSGMSLLASYYGHGFHPLVLLPIAAAITVGLQPSYVWGDLGWQLSFSAFAGVMIVAPLLQAYFFGNKEPSIIRQILGETVAAHLVTIPIIAISFGTVSNVAIIANVLVVPFVPLAMLLVFGCGIGAIFAVPFIEVLSVPTTWLLTYMTTVATTVADLPWAQASVEVPHWVWAAYVICLSGLCYYAWKKTNYNFRQGEAIMG